MRRDAFGGDRHDVGVAVEIDHRDEQRELVEPASTVIMMVTSPACRPARPSW